MSKHVLTTILPDAESFRRPSYGEFAGIVLFLAVRPGTSLLSDNQAPRAPGSRVSIIHLSSAHVPTDRADVATPSASTEATCARTLRGGGGEGAHCVNCCLVFGPSIDFPTMPTYTRREISH